MKKLRHASLFSGIGGPEVAAAMLGWENVFHCEINPFGRKVLEYWFPNSDSYEDITKTDFTKYRGQIDVLTGGFPCQPFSYAGKRGGQSDDRYLWPKMLRVIDEIRPTWVVGENVAGIATMVESCEISEMGSEASLFEEGDGVHRFRAEHTFTIERICRDLESKGYSVQPVLIPACAVGAPHRRDRVFIVAHSSGSGSKSHTQDGRSESDGSDELSQSGKWREQTEFDNGFYDVPRFADNTDGCHDMRESGEHDGESREKRISERHSVWKPGESGDVRSEIQGLAEDPVCHGCECRKINQQGSEWHLRHIGAGDCKRLCGEERTDSADSYGRGRCEVDEHIQSEFADGAESFCDGGKRNVADATGERLEGSTGVRVQDGQERKCGIPFLQHSRSCGASMLPEERWRDFPSVSPVHRGNDGLPFDVDNLTISFAKWRNESIKAYGNAIVPQVMYRIFQCIEEIEHEPS